MIPAIAPTSASEPSLGKRKAEETPGARKVQVSATKAMETLEAGQKTLKAQQAWILTEIQRIGEFLQKGQETSTPATVKTSPLTGSPSTADQVSHNRGIELANQGNFEQALRCFEAAIAVKPDNIFYLSSRGVCKLRLRRYEEALVDFNKAISNLPPEDKSPLHVCLLSHRGGAYLNLLRHEEALVDAKKALEWDPSNHQARYNRGVCYRELGHFKEALEDASTLLKEGEKQGAQYAVAAGLYLQGTVHMKQRSFSEAVRDFRGCIQYDSKRVWKQAPALLEQAKKRLSETAAPGTSNT